jgi:hypothetical protein
MTHRHLTEEQLIAHGPDAELPPDIAGCDRCLALHQSVTQTLREVTATAAVSADAAFPPERLARQRARILTRLQRHGQQARVLAFPLPRTHRPALLHPRSLRRWVAAAAAAGLIVGLVAGRTVHDIPSLHVSMGLPTTSYSRAVRPRESADDELLREVERAVVPAGPTALWPIDKVTPAAWAWATP